jgi:hypothetical protein
VSKQQLAHEPKQMSNQSDLLPCTIVIEWENAIDVKDEWADRAVAGLERELEATAPLMSAKPIVSYLFNSEAVNPESIRRAIAEAGPKLCDYAQVEIVPTNGLSYYELKNHGAARADTEVTIFLDSDAAPQPGWLRSMVAPFNEPSVMAVGGITVLAHEDFLSRTLALIWIFGLFEEREETARSWGIYANNTAVRTAFFRRHPFPKLNAFKYSCVFWLRSILAQNHRYVRVPDAVTVHAPHPNYRFFFWRAWTTGVDRDFYVSHTRTPSRLGRTLRAGTFFLSKTVRALWRITTKRRSVGLPLWQVSGAMILAFGYSATLLVGQLWGVVSRRHDGPADLNALVYDPPTTA